MADVLALVVEVGERLVLSDDQRIDTPVVIEVMCGGSNATDPLDFPAITRVFCETSTNRPSSLFW